MSTPQSVGTIAQAPALALVQRMFDEGFAAGRAEVVGELCAPDLVEHQFGMAGRGREAIEHVEAAIRDVHRMAPDITFTIEDSVVDGDTVWVRVRGRGHATGPFFGPPSGRPIDVTVFDVVRIADGRIVEHWGVPDRFALLAQTGVLDRLATSTPSSAPRTAQPARDGAAAKQG
jgi:predicted ester cyclase